jgi:hypothetical protein
MNHGSSAQFLKLPELRSRLSVMPSVREIVDALYQGKRYLPPILMNGQALRLHISFRWPMKVIGMTTITAAGSQFCRKQEELSILCKMGCCLRVVYISYLTAMPSQLTLTYVYLILHSLKRWLMIILE